jgi:hypothetical protein
LKVGKRRKREKGREGKREHLPFFPPSFLLFLPFFFHPCSLVVFLRSRGREDSVGLELLQRHVVQGEENRVCVSHVHLGLLLH